MSYSLITGLFSGMNTATDLASGAIDIVVVEQPDGSLKCTPFHVRFGRLKVLRSKEKVIRIMVNGKLTELCMKTGETGEAYFVHEASGPVDRDLVASPIDLGPVKSQGTTTTSSPSSPTTTNNGPFSSATNTTTVPTFIPTSMPIEQAYFRPITSPIGSPNLVPISSSSPNQPHYQPNFDIDEEVIYEKFIPIDDSDSDEEESVVAGVTQDASRVVDLEREKKREDGITTSHMLNSTPPPLVNTSFPPTINIDAKTMRDMNAITSPSSPRASEISSTVTAPIENPSKPPPSETPTKKSGWGWASGLSSWFGFKSNNDTDEFQGIKTKGNNSFVEQQFLEVMAKHYNYDALSGRYINNPVTTPSPSITKSPPFEQVSNNNLSIPRNDSCKNLISDTSDDDLSYDALTSEHNESKDSNVAPNESDDQKAITMDKNFDDDATTTDEEDDLEKNYHSDNESLSSLKPSLPPHMRTNNHFELMPQNSPISKSAPGNSTSFEELFKQHQLSKLKRQISPPSTTSNSRSSSPETFSVNNTSTQTLSTEALTTTNGAMELTKPTIVTITPISPPPNLSDPNLQKKNEKTYWRWFWTRPGATASTDAVNPSTSQINNEVNRVTSQPKVFDPTGEFKVLKKSLRPTSEELKALGLKYGRNEIKFLVTSRILGTQEVNAYIYLWKHSDKIVVSDVDGTITKSDALGHILPMLGQDWSHSGIGKLYTKIVENGYRMLYLTSRSIIQSGSTKRYIFTLQQEDAMLPEGPVVMSPDRLFAALHREVILKKPEEFKKAALSDVLELFPKDTNPFFAGFGNRITDIISYSFVGIPDHKIFTVDPTGLIQVYGISHESYWNIFKLVDEMFPDLNQKVDTSNDFNSFAFWRMPIQSSSDFK
ncbi:hypothetical protein C9374_008905 [Naegleria lovaniensis]|uniref:LNS2/PITP domain-containing protein n=1 Tax=Naegleria lovaniensis TaxID=51637 RepID=A0AA88GIQ7_NAELO|nr:uncharacterized protein C9374_008905 [Naegleria lovaniensis]KAG2377820.1 hypothetical protein C9374_008905 [Naegleria lovaniensis]